MIGSIIIYTVVLAICVVGTYFADQKNKKWILWCVIAFITLFSGLRGVQVGIDTASYLEKFAAIAGNRLDEAYALEETFKYICYVLLRICDRPWFLLTLFALVTNGCILLRLWDMRKVASLPWMVAVYYMSYYFMTLNCMRQFCAVAIVFYATRFLEEKRIIPYVVCVLTAAMFHKSAVVSLVLVFLLLFYWKSLTKKQKAFFQMVIRAIPVLLIVAIIFLRKSIIYYLQKFHLSLGMMIPAKIVFALAALIYIFIICENSYFSWKAKELSSRARVSFTIINCTYLLGLFVSMLGYMFMFVERLGWYFIIFECPFFGMIMKARNRKIRICAGTFLALLLGYIYMYSMLHNSQGTIPYALCW